METSERHFELFQMEAERWLNYFNLMDWDVDFTHEPMPKGAEPVQASTVSSWLQKCAVLMLNKNWDERYLNNEQIRKAAFHEVCELLLAELRYLAEERFIMDGDVVHATHGVIQRLTNTIWKDQED